MVRHRSVLTWLLALIAVFVVSCSGPTAKPLTYSAAQLEQIQQSASGIMAGRDRLAELKTLIENRKWNDVISFIHGPLGDLRSQMNTLAGDFFPNTKTAALKESRAVFERLVSIDSAAKAGNYELAIGSYAKLLKDVDEYLDLVPEA
jgi:photosystem II protein PsbQ